MQRLHVLCSILVSVCPITSKIVYLTDENEAISATMDGKARAGTLDTVAHGRVVLWIADLVELRR